MTQFIFADRNDRKEVEGGLRFAPKFDDKGLITAVALDVHTKQPLMLAYMNKESLKMTLACGEAVYYSRSRQEIWHKGKSSGHVQKVKEIYTDCDQDALVLYVEQIGEGACHTGRPTCFFRKVAEVPSEGQVGLEMTESQAFDPESVYGKK